MSDAELPRRRVIAWAGGAIVAAGTGAVLLSRRSRPKAVPPRSVDQVRRLDFTYLPEPVRRDTWYRAPDRESISGSVTGSGPYATLTWPVAAPDPGGAWRPVAPAERVDGRSTLWRGDGGVRTASPVSLRWEREPGHWAEVVLGGAGGDTVAVAVRVAAGARFDRAEPVRLPVRPRGTVGGLVLQQVSVTDHGDESWSASVTYARTPPPVSEGGQYPSAQVRVGPMTQLERFLMGIATTAPNTTVDGHAARQQFDPPAEPYHEMLRLFDVDGLLVTINVFGVEVRNLLAPDGAAGLFRRLVLSPDWR